MTTIDTGNTGETMACSYLKKQGYKILERNWRYKNHHEIDIVAFSPDNALVAIEVRSHQEPKEYQPFESIHERKLKQIHDALELYARINQADDVHLQVDVVSVIISDKSFEHFKAVV